ncbi:MAG: GtrA family protein [Dethiobacteria bacterium]
MEKKQFMENQSPSKLTTRQNIIQIIKFTLFSASAGIIEFTSFTLLFSVAGLVYWPSYLIALILSVIYNFTLNRHFTFKSAANVPIAMLKVAGYYLVFTPLSTWWGDALTKLGWNEYVVLLGTMLVNLTTEYLFCRFVVYRNMMNTNILARKEMEKKQRPGI